MHIQSVITPGHWNGHSEPNFLERYYAMSDLNAFLTYMQITDQVRERNMGKVTYIYTQN